MSWTLYQPSYAQTWLNLPTRLRSDILLGTCEKAKILKLCVSILFESLRICAMITYKKVDSCLLMCNYV